MGFTLLEIVITITLLAVLLAAVFGIAAGTTQLAAETQYQQDRESEAHTFAHLCDRLFRALSAQSQVRLRVKQSGNRYLSQLAILNPPAVLGPSGNILMMLETEETPSGYLQVVLKTYASEDIQAMESGDSSFANKAARQRLVLLENVAQCKWAFLSPASGEWEPLFNEHMNLLQALKNLNTPGGTLAPPPTAALLPTTAPPAGSPVPPSSAGSQTSVGQPMQVGGNYAQTRPGLVELNLEMAGQANRRFVFWAPPSQLPTPPTQMPGSALTPLAPGPLAPVNTPTPVAPTH